MILTGEKLQNALNGTISSIRLLDLDNSVLSLVSAFEVPDLIADSRYQFVGNLKRVRFIRRLDPSAIMRKPLPFVECLRTCASAVLWPYVESYGDPMI